METKTCNRCDAEKPVDEYWPKYDRPGNRIEAVCKSCKAERNRDYAWVRGLRSMGVDPDWYDRKLAEQGGGCAICGSTEGYKRNGRERRLPVDHDHETGLAREILCDPCNHAVGMVRESPDIAIGVAMYLLKHGKA